MKKTILTIAASVAAMFSIAAQEAGDKINFADLNVEKVRSEVSITFDAEISNAAKKGLTVVYAPFITDGSNKIALPAIVVHGKKTSVMWERHEWAAGVDATQVVEGDDHYAHNGDTVSYSVITPYQDWMYGANLEVDALTVSCCNSFNEVFMMKDSLFIASDIPFVEIEAIAELPEVPVEIEIVEEPKPTAERIAEVLPFVLPAEEFSPEEPVKFFDDERDDVLTIYFKINDSDIDLDYADNRQMLENLTAAIDIIMASNDNKVDQLVIAGFASPDGSTTINMNLANQRTLAVKNHLMSNTNLTDSDIFLFNGSADWEGLVKLVEIDESIPNREELLDILINKPVWDPNTFTGRLTLIKRLNGGETYEYLAENTFPKLRAGTFIRLYYSAEE